VLHFVASAEPENKKTQNQDRKYPPQDFTVSWFCITTFKTGPPKQGR
jgi:hypothetical protein